VNRHHPQLNADQVWFIHKMLDALDPFFKIRTAMPARCIEAFLLVALREGQSCIAYAKDADMSPTTMSRNLLDLGERDRKGDEGAGLIEGFEDILDRRQKSYRLTHKGRALLAAITGRVK